MDGIETLRKIVKLIEGKSVLCRKEVSDGEGNVEIRVKGEVTGVTEYARKTRKLIYTLDSNYETYVEGEKVNHVYPYGSDKIYLTLDTISLDYDKGIKLIIEDIFEQLNKELEFLVNHESKGILETRDIEVTVQQIENKYLTGI